MLHSTAHFGAPFSFLHRSAFRPNRELALREVSLISELGLGLDLPKSCNINEITLAIGLRIERLVSGHGPRGEQKCNRIF